MRGSADDVASGRTIEHAGGVLAGIQETEPG